MPQVKPTPRQKSAARLYAVQAVYQLILNSDQTSRSVIDDFLVFRIGVEPDLQELAKPEVNLFGGIVGGVEKRRATLEDVLGNHLKGGQTIASMRENEPLLLAILLCGGYELMAHNDIDAPIIISDYLNVTHSYYQGKESNVVNGILDSFKTLYRPA